jgi:hypothetical protein
MPAPVHARSVFPDFGHSGCESSESDWPANAPYSCAAAPGARVFGL